MRHELRFAACWSCLFSVGVLWGAAQGSKEKEQVQNMTIHSVHTLLGILHGAMVSISVFNFLEVFFLEILEAHTQCHFYNLTLIPHFQVCTDQSLNSFERKNQVHHSRTQSITIMSIHKESNCAHNEENLRRIRFCIPMFSSNFTMPFVVWSSFLCHSVANTRSILLMFGIVVPMWRECCALWCFKRMMCLYFCDLINQ